MSTCRHTCLYTCLHVDTHVYTHFPTQGEEGEGGVGADEVGRGGEEGQAEEAQGLARTKNLRSSTQSNVRSTARSNI